MNSTHLLGVLVVVLSGLIVGTSPWPIKCMKRFEYEHWGFTSTLVGMLLAPWAFTFWACPDALGAFREVGPWVLLKASVFSLCWGIANILYMLCFVKIGVSLANGILAGVGISMGVVTPMLFKGTGVFKDAPEVFSLPGWTILGGVAVMLCGVLLVSLAGLGRERERASQERPSSGMRQGLVMAVLAAVLSTGLSFSFVYSQEAILNALIKSRHADEVAAHVAVWATVFLAGATLNLIYPAYLMCKHKSWPVLFGNLKENVLAAIFGLSFFIGVALLGKGMLLLGALGASVGWGVQQTAVMLGSQSVGFLGGEWKGIGSKPRTLMFCSIAVLIAAAAIMTFGKSLSAN
jgi:L-rhamnose-H+ transport protein